jgi:uncharacterized protein with HEPN domain
LSFRDERLYLDDMAEAGALLRSFLAAKSYHEFATSDLLKSGRPQEQHFGWV